LLKRPLRLLFLPSGVGFSHLARLTLIARAPL